MESVRNVYDSTTQKLSDGVESIRWSIISIVMWITIPALLIMLAVVFCVYYAKLCLIRRASTTAASALVDLAHTFALKTPKANRKLKINSLTVHASAPDSHRLFVPRIYALLSSLNMDNNLLPYIEVVINGAPIIALFDSGASISYMRKASLCALSAANQARPSNCTPA